MTKSQTLNLAWALLLVGGLSAFGSLILLRWADFPGAFTIGVVLAMLGLTNIAWGGYFRYSLGWKIDTEEDKN